ncbi:MAG: rhodanese-like domain-containing protein [Candidatus Methylacidiphilales bacterium]|nr:rhodanese-like domain-containing protein [Candidatus Methylacidiphilales bacterium]
MKTVLSLLCLTVLAVFTVQAGENAVKEISHADLQKAISDGKVLLIDVNGSESYKQGHIPGAIDFQSKKDDLAKHLPKDKGALVVAYCGNEHCGAYMRGAKAALDLGYTNVAHYKPGIAGWIASKGEIEKPKS